MYRPLVLGVLLMIACQSPVAPADPCAIERIETTFDANGQVVVSVNGDEDCVALYVTVGDGSAPSDPTAMANDGDVTGNNGTIATGVKITQGNEAIVKAVGENADGSLGPVRTFRHDRRIGPCHQDATSRSHTGDTLETTLETITIPAGALGSNGAFRLTFQVLLNIPAAGARLRVRLNGTSVATSLFSATSAVRAHAEIILHNDGATNAQRIISKWIRSDGVIDLGTSDQTEDSTSALVLTITVDLDNAGDDAALTSTLAELVGTL